jgi:hypothetical protein
MEVRGSIADRPWGVTLGAIALRRHTGQLTIESDGKRYGIAFDDGAIVGASSPLAADTIARIALTNHFITSPQVADLTRRLAAASLGRDRDRDEVEVVSEAIRCSPEQALKLRHRLIAQRAARTFSIERGDFVLDDRIALPVFPGVAVDHRHAIYLGVRTNLSEQRLIDDLRELGAFFVLKPEAIDELPRFGFEPSAHPVIEALKVGTSLPELEASHRELDPRFAQAIIYALVSCAACVISSRTASATLATPTPTPALSPAPARPSVGRTVTPPLHAQGIPPALGPRRPRARPWRRRRPPPNRAPRRRAPASERPRRCSRRAPAGPRRPRTPLRRPMTPGPTRPPRHDRACGPIRSSPRRRPPGGS